MAVDKLVDSTQLNSDLTSVANAIRTKGGTSAQLAFPSGFVSAIEGIQTGTAPTGTININTNGTHDVTDYANANVSVPTGTARSSSDLTASNLTVTAPAGLYAENAAKTLSDANLVAGNIKKDVTIFGTTGTYEGSGGGLSLLNSGTYTRNTTDQTLHVPVSYTGTPKLVVVEIDAPLASTNQGYSAAKYIVDTSDPLPLQTGAAAGLAIAYYMNTSGVLSVAAYNPNSITLSSSEITVSRINGTYLWQNNDYNWYIYG